jgi:hypothetical protein
MGRIVGQPGIDEEINHPIAATNSSQPTPTNFDFSGLRRSTTMTNQIAHLRSARPQTTHLRSANPQSFSSAPVPVSTIFSFGGL